MITENFEKLKKRNKILFTLIIAISIIVFWKGIWGLADIFFDEILFQNHYFWSNLTATILGALVLFIFGVSLDKLA
jgi:hypothetical protein